MIFRILLVATLATVNPLSGMTQGGDQSFDPLQLNIRLSPTALHPPSHLIKQQWVLAGYRLGRLGPQAPQAVIIEDDARRRLLILSATDEGRVLVYQVGDLPVDVAARLRPALVCVHTRQCQNHRMDPAGELGCLALCLLEHLRE
jgi:hypothetical protein